jgi:alpha-L-arabinofuranosidase
MRAVDPGIKIGAIADENYSRSMSPFFANWTEHLLRTAASEIDFIAVHCGYAPTLWEDRGWSPRTVYSAMLAAPQLIREHLANLSARIETLAPGRDIKIAVTEWGPFFNSSRDSRFVDHTKTLGSALFVASTLPINAKLHTGG